MSTLTDEEIKEKAAARLKTVGVDWRDWPSDMWDDYWQMYAIELKAKSIGRNKQERRAK